MTAQIKYGDVHFGHVHEPDMQSKFLGCVGEYPNMQPQSYVKPEQKSKSDKTSTLHGSHVDRAGIHVAAKVPTYKIVETQGGPVKVPIETQTMQYNPTENTFNFLTQYHDTRLHPYPVRYFQ